MTGMTRFDEVYFDQALFDRTLYILKQSSDSGSGVEALGSKLFAVAEAGSGVDVSSLLAALVKGETGSGIEVLLFRLISQDDSGLGVDLSALSKSLIVLTALEQGRGTERLVAKIESASKEGTIRLPPATGAMTIPSKQVGMSSKEVRYEHFRDAQPG